MSDMPVTRKGLKFMVVGFLVMIAGYILMTGGGSKDPNVFNWSMFNFQRLTLSPIVITVGVVIEIIAIMNVGGSKKEEE